MPFEGEEKRLYNQQYHLRKREQTKRSEQEVADLAKAKVDDESRQRYKSEAKSYTELAKLFYGLVEDQEAQDAEDKKRKKKKRKPMKPAALEILGQIRTFQEWLDMRDRARKDLFWLGTELLKKDFVRESHQIMFDQFVQKNFDGVYHEGYRIKDVHDAIAAQDREKELILLAPRGSYKSTADGVDCVSWMINVPDVRILIIAGEFKLATAFMKEIKGYFYLAEGADPSDFHALFPDYVLTGVDGRSKEPIECPARNLSQKEPSLWVNSIDANLSGWHCDIKKGDDVVTDENSKNETARANLKEKYDGTRDLCDEWGFTDHIGTRYYIDDWYGKKMEPIKDEDGNVLEVSLKIYCSAVWDVLPGFEEVPLRSLTANMVKLNYPHKATFKSLRLKLLENERAFRNQQLNEPSDPIDDVLFKVTFDHDALVKHSYAASAAPKTGNVYVTWDWAYSTGKYSDLSVGVAGRVYQREDGEWGIVVLEVIYGRWKPTELAFHIVQFNKKWNPTKTLIEKTICADLLKAEVVRQAHQYGVSLDVYWQTPDMKTDAKRNRIKSLEVKLTNDLLWFVTGAWLEETFVEFTRYTGEKSTKARKDDIPDAISFLVHFCPRLNTTKQWKQC